MAINNALVLKHGALVLNEGRVDAQWFGHDLYVDTPESLQVILEGLRTMGYKVKDTRDNSRVTVEEMERNNHSTWFATLDIRVGKCASCSSYISTRGIAASGHTCEVCGAVTYMELVPGSSFRFRFVGTPWLGPELSMEVVHWDHETGELYVLPEPREHYGLSIVTGEKAQEYLDKHLGSWQYAELDGQQVIKLEYWPANKTEQRAQSPIEAIDTQGHLTNYRMVKLWNYREYDEYFSDLLVPETINLYETWHWAPLSPSRELYKRILHAGGGTSREDWYRPGETIWVGARRERMDRYVRSYTTIDPAAWTRFMPTMPHEGNPGIQAMKRFCEEMMQPA